MYNKYRKWSRRSNKHQSQQGVRKSYKAMYVSIIHNIINNKKKKTESKISIKSRVLLQTMFLPKCLYYCMNMCNTQHILHAGNLSPVRL